MAKEKKDPNIHLFEDKPIETWLGIIEEEAKGDEKKVRELKNSARRALTVKNMSEYILNTVDEKELPEAKKNFKAMTYTGNTRVLKNGKEVSIQNVNKVATHFVKTYMPGLRVDDKPREGAFDFIKDW